MCKGLGSQAWAAAGLSRQFSTVVDPASTSCLHQALNRPVSAVEGGFSPSTTGCPGTASESLK